MIKIVFLIVITYLLPLFFKESRNVKTLSLMWIIITLCQSVSLINGYYFRTIGAEIDALTFHNNAIHMLESGSFAFGYWADFYSLLLAVFYFFVGSKSIVVGQEISIIFYISFLIVFLKLNKIMDLDDYKNSSILILGFLPSIFLHCSITLREPYETFFLIFSIYCFIKYYKIKSIRWLLLSMSASILLGMFHPGLSVLSFFLIIFFAFGIVDFSFKRLVENIFSKKYYIFALIGTVLSLALIIYAVNLNNKGRNLVSSIIKGDVVKYAKIKRHNHMISKDYNASNANYGIELNTDSIVSTVTSMGNIFFHYYVSPLPWKENSLKGVYVIFENLLRMVLIVFSIKVFFYSNKKMKKLIVFLLLVYFLISFIWAMGTVNYGTAIRHHLVGYWILVLLGVPSFIESRNCIQKKLYLCREKQKI